MEINVLALGGGVDSTALAVIDANREKAATYFGISAEELDLKFPPCNAWVFADTGAEFAATYLNIQTLGDLASQSGKECHTVRRKQERIQDWLLRLGILPLMPGASHVCSLKFKGEVMQAWADERFPGSTIMWAVGIEANEDKRCKRFTCKPGARHLFRYPLRELNLTRQLCLDLLGFFGWEYVHKSSCPFCPYMKTDEIVDVMLNKPEEADLAEQIENKFKETSPVKHAAWIAAGRPTNKAGRAPRGMWRRDSWAEGARLYAQTVNGKRLTVSEWRDYAKQQKQRAV